MALYLAESCMVIKLTNRVTNKRKDLYLFCPLGGVEATLRQTELGEIRRRMQYLSRNYQNSAGFGIKVLTCNVPMLLLILFPFI